MNAIKLIKTCVIFLIITSCSHIKLDTPKNDVIDAVEYKGQKYLIPIPKGYCRYNPENKKDKPFINEWLSKQNISVKQKELKVDLIALYANCPEKEKLHSGEIREASRVISIGIMPNKELQPTRSQLAKLTYTDSNALRNKNIEILTEYVKDQISDDKIKESGFSKERQQIITEEYNYFLSHPNIDIKTGYDDQSSYYYALYKDQYLDLYSEVFFTKLYSNLIIIAFENSTKKSFFNSGTQNHLVREGKNYLKQFLEINDRNNFKEFSYKNKKLRIFTPNNFSSLEASKKITEMYNNNKSFHAIFKESFFRFDPIYLTRITVGVPSNKINFTSKQLESKESYFENKVIDRVKTKYNSTKENDRRRNAIFYPLFIDPDQIAIVAETLINNIPTTIMAEIISRSGKAQVKPEDIESLKKEVMEYIDFLDQNQ